MASKQQPQNFQQMQHTPHLEEVRTDIKIHCQTEPLLQELLNELNLKQTEFDRVFKTGEVSLDKKKRRKAKKKPPNVIKLIVAAHLNLLWSKARLDGYRQNADTERFYQQEIMKFKKSHPDLASRYINLASKISPEHAVEFLNDIINQYEISENKLENLSKQHSSQIETFSQKAEQLMQKFQHTLKEHGYVLSKTEMQKLFKLLGGVA